MRDRLEPQLQQVRDHRVGSDPRGGKVASQDQGELVLAGDTHIGPEGATFNSVPLILLCSAHQPLYNAIWLKIERSTISSHFRHEHHNVLAPSVRKILDYLCMFGLET